MDDNGLTEARKREFHVGQTHWVDSHPRHLRNCLDLGWLWQGLVSDGVVQKEVGHSEAGVRKLWITVFSLHHREADLP